MEHDPRAEQLATAYWSRTSPAAWNRLKPEVRAELVERADTWLHAALAAGLLAPAIAPSEDHARDEATSRRDLADHGHRLTLIGWTR